MYELRLRLSKLGRIKYVSHLDMFRLMQRAVRRAHIPLWYTEGFNPHPYISFLLALSLGVEGEREPVDIRITDDTPPEEIRRRLNAVLPEGLRVETAAPPKDKPAAIAFGVYDVVYDPADLDAKTLSDVLAAGGLTCQKSGKSGHKKVVKTVDVSAHIRDWSVQDAPEGTLLCVTLPAGSTFNLNPMQLTEGVSEKLGRELLPTRMRRKTLLCADGKEFE